MSKTVIIILLSSIFLGACLPLEEDRQAEPVSSSFESPLVADPIIPNQFPVVMQENQWRLTRISRYGALVYFDSIEPVLATFRPGFFSFLACNSIGYAIDTTDTEYATGYRFLEGAATARGCDGGGSEQESNFLSALSDTNRYYVDGDRLILSGENRTYLTFVIDNEAEKPPDWS